MISSFPPLPRFVAGQKKVSASAMNRLLEYVARSTNLMVGPGLTIRRFPNGQVVSLAPPLRPLLPSSGFNVAVVAGFGTGTYGLQDTSFMVLAPGEDDPKNTFEVLAWSYGPEVGELGKLKLSGGSAYPSLDVLDFVRYSTHLYPIEGEGGLFRFETRKVCVDWFYPRGCVAQVVRRPQDVPGIPETPVPPPP